MRLAICGASQEETEQLCNWVRQFDTSGKTSIKLLPVDDLDVFWQQLHPGDFNGIILGLEDTAGFLAARRIQMQDSACRILMIGDTDRYVLPCIHLHVRDFILRPLSQLRFEQGLRRLMQSGGE